MRSEPVCRTRSHAEPRSIAVAKADLQTNSSTPLGGALACVWPPRGRAAGDGQLTRALPPVIRAAREWRPRVP